MVCIARNSLRLVNAGQREVLPTIRLSKGDELKLGEMNNIININRHFVERVEWVQP